MTDRARDDDLADVADVDESRIDDDPTGAEAIEDGVGYVPPDSPTAAQAFGTTAEEQRRGESLDRRLSEEEPDVGAPRGARRTDDEDDALDAEDAALRVVEGADLLPGATDDPVDHYVEDADAAEAAAGREGSAEGAEPEDER